MTIYMIRREYDNLYFTTHALAVKGRAFFGLKSNTRIVEMSVFDSLPDDYNGIEYHPLVYRTMDGV
jgi:hypothetical protein